MPDHRSPEDEPSVHGVTTGFLARTLGVSPTTLRSWDRRYGLGPAARQDGRHRRWSPQDVSMLKEMCRLTATGVPPAQAARSALAHARGALSPPAVAPPVTPGAHRGSRSPGALPLGDVRQECRGLARAAVRLDATAVQDLLTDVVATHGTVVAWEEVMAPALRAAGRRWESSGDRYVEVEHLLSWHISSTLRHVCVSAPGPRRDGPPVLLACLPGERHTLPLEALGAALAELGVPTLMLGGAVPADALDGAVRRVGPAAAALWAQSRSTAGLPLAEHLATLRWGVRGARRRSAVLLCGPGWSRTASDLPRPPDLREAVRMLAATAPAART